MHDCDWDVFKFSNYVGRKKREPGMQRWAEQIDERRPGGAAHTSGYPFWMKSNRNRTESSQAKWKWRILRTDWLSECYDWLSDWIRIRASRQNNPDGIKTAYGGFQFMQILKGFLASSAILRQLAWQAEKNNGAPAKWKNIYVFNAPDALVISSIWWIRRLRYWRTIKYAKSCFVSVSE